MDSKEETTKEVPKEVIFTSKDLHNSKPLPEQKWCAYTYLLAKVPQDNKYGVIKVICTGATEEAVKKTVTTMLNEGNLEKNLPSIKYCPTGEYKLLINGSDPVAEKDVYNTTTKTMTTELEREITDKKKKAAQELREAEAKLREESEDALINDPYSFDTYCAHRGALTTASSRLIQLQGEMDMIKKVKERAQKAVNEITRKHGNYKLKYKAKFQATEEINDNEESDTVPVATASTTTSSQ